MISSDGTPPNGWDTDFTEEEVRANAGQHGRQGLRIDLTGEGDDNELALIRLLVFHPDLAMIVEPIIGKLPCADARIQKLYEGVKAAALQGEPVLKAVLQERLAAAGLDNADIKALSDRVCDPALLDDVSVAPAIAQSVVRNRARFALGQAAENGPADKLDEAIAKFQALSRDQPTDGEADTCHWHGKTDAPLQTPLLIDGLAPRSGIGIIAGQFGYGKSLLAMNLSAAVVTGRPFMGRAIKRTGGVLWFAAEGSETIAGRLAAAVADGTGTLPHHLDPAALPFAYYTDAPVLSEPSSLPVWLKRVEYVRSKLRDEYGCDLALIVVDTYSAAVKPADANDTAEAEVMMGRLRELERAGDCLLLTVDHYGKATETGVRNSSVKEASSDVTLAMLGERGEGAAIANTRIELRKFRAGKAGYNVPYSIATVTVSDGDETFDAPVLRMVLDQASHTPPKAAEKGSPMPKSLKLFLQVVDKMLDEAGEAVTPQAGMPVVRAVRESLVHAEWMKTYSSDGDDEKKRKEAARKAFKRALVAAQADRKRMSREVDGVRWIWNPWQK